jgi:hypothetical protein
MGMEHHQGPKRRRVGNPDPTQRIQTSIRLSRVGGKLIARMQQRETLHPAGCSMGDVIEIAIRELARKKADEVAPVIEMMQAVRSRAAD